MCAHAVDIELASNSSCAYRCLRLPIAYVWKCAASAAALSVATLLSQKYKIKKRKTTTKIQLLSQRPFIFGRYRSIYFFIPYKANMHMQIITGLVN